MQRSFSARGRRRPGLRRCLPSDPCIDHNHRRSGWGHHADHYDRPHPERESELNDAPALNPGATKLRSESPQAADAQPRPPAGAIVWLFMNDCEPRQDRKPAIEQLGRLHGYGW
jgi:hypothetical protein